MRQAFSYISKTFLAIFLVITGFAILMSYLSWQSIKSDRFKDLSNTASFLNSFYELSFYQRELGLLSVGERMLSITGPDEKEQRLAIALNAINVHGEFLAIGLVDTTGQLITFTGSLNQSSLPNLATSEKTKRTFEQAKNSSQIVIGEVYFFDEISDWIVPIRVPIRDKQNRLLAVNTSAVSVHKLFEELKSFDLNPMYRMVFVNNTFNTIQLCYPLKRNEFEQTLHKSADFYVDYKEIDEVDSMVYFRANNTLVNSDIIGVKSTTNALDHYVVVTAPMAILFSDFRSDLISIVVIYFILSAGLFLVFLFIRSTEVKHQAALDAERDYSNNIIKSTSALIVGISSDGVCKFVNPAIELATGYNKEEIIGRNWWNLLYPGDSFEQVEKLFEIVATKEVRNYEMTLTAKTGIKKTVSWNSISIYDNNKSLIEIIGIGIDITGQREAEKAIAESQANLQSIFESTTNTIALFDADMNLVEFNSAFVKTYQEQLQGGPIKGSPVLDTLREPTSTNLKNLLRSALRGEKVSDVFQYPIEKSVYYFLHACNPVYQDGMVTGATMFSQDITELKQAQEKLREYNEDLEGIVEQRSREIVATNAELQESNELLTETLNNLQKAQKQLIESEKMASLGVLAAGVGHEINNPLNFISGGVNALSGHMLKQGLMVDEDTSYFIKIINEGVSRATAIVKGLSHFSRMTDLHNEKCDVHKIIDNCLLMLANKLKRKVELHKDYTKDEVVLQGNEGQLHQAILNILSNAEQAISDKGNIFISTSKGNGQIKILIKDDGVGILPDHMSKISDPFFTTRAPGEGVGLGLSIAYKIIAEHNGKISVLSTVKKGSEFTIILPC